MSSTIRGWVGPVDWNSPDFDWNGNPQGIVVHKRPVSATLTVAPAEFRATVTKQGSPTATVTKQEGWTAVLEVASFVGVA